MFKICLFDAVLTFKTKANIQLESVIHDIHDPQATNKVHLLD